MHRPLITHRSLLISAAALALAGCYTPVQSYEGDALADSQVARVMGRTNPSLLLALSDAYEPPLPGMPEKILIAKVDGELTNSEFVEVMPGTRTLRIYGELKDLRPKYRVLRNEVTLQFEAEAGATYDISAQLSDIQPPWSYELRKRFDPEPVATSQPTLEDLDLGACRG